MTKEQYEFLMGELEIDLERVHLKYDNGELNGEHADLQERRIYEEMAELERDYTEQQNC